MSATILQRDAGFRRWLAARPGLWLEVGVLDDPAMLVTVMAERRRAGLPPLLWTGEAHPARRRTRSRGLISTTTQAAAGVAIGVKERA